MATNDLPEQKSSGTNGSKAVIEFEDGTVGFPEDGPMKPVMGVFHEHGLGKEVSWKTIVTEVDHDPRAIMQVINELRDLLLVTETEHSGEQWFRMEDTGPTREFVSKVTDS